MARLPLFLLMVCVLLCTAFSLRPQLYRQRLQVRTKSSTSLLASSSSIKSLKLVVASSLIGLLACQEMVFAKDNEGTKTDKRFESCVSKCVFDATKPPPVGASAERLEENGMKSRTDILRECRPKCAKTSEQLLLGSPKANKISAAEPIPE